MGLRSIVIRGELEGTANGGEDIVIRGDASEDVCPKCVCSDDVRPDDVCPENVCPKDVCPEG